MRRTTDFITKYATERIYLKSSRSYKNTPAHDCIPPFEDKKFIGYYNQNYL